MKIEISDKVWCIIIFLIIILAFFLFHIFLNDPPCKVCEPCICAENCEVEIALTNYTLTILNSCIRELGLCCYNLTEEEVEKVLIG
jgi:hypothetical protein